MKKFFSILFFVLSLSLTFGCCLSLERYSQPEKYDLMSHMEDSTVAFVVPNVDEGRYASFCSGVWVTPMHILTAKHCVDGFDGVATSDDVGKMYRFHTRDDYGMEYPPEDLENVYVAETIAMDPFSDLALLESQNDIPHHIAKISNYSQIVKGLKLHITGHPLEYRYSYAPGVVSAIRRTYEEHLFPERNLQIIQVITHIGPGNSGGGAFDEQGKLVGICSYGITSDAEGYQFFVHQNAIQNFLKRNKINYYK